VNAGYLSSRLGRARRAGNLLRALRAAEGVASAAAAAVLCSLRGCRRGALSSHAMTSDTTSPPSTAFRAAGDLCLLTWPALDASGAGAAVTGALRRGLVRALRDAEPEPERRRRPGPRAGEPAPAGGRLRRDPGDFVFARQVHGAGVAVVAEADGGAARNPSTTPSRRGCASHHLTRGSARDPDRGLRSIVLHDPVAGVLACVHAGWRGTVARVTAATLAAMQGLGTRPSDVIAGIGPAVGADRYQVGPTSTRPSPGPSARPRPGSSAPTRRRPAAGCSTCAPPTATPSTRPACPAPGSTPPTSPPAPSPAISSATAPRAPAAAWPWPPGCGPACPVSAPRGSIFRYRGVRRGRRARGADLPVRA